MRKWLEPDDYLCNLDEGGELWFFLERLANQAGVTTSLSVYIGEQNAWNKTLLQFISTLIRDIDDLKGRTNE